MSHTVKIHRWVNGILKIANTSHATLEEALEHARHMTRGTGHFAKIYNDDAELLHTVNNEGTQSTYA
jgi:hypothetical protein